MTTTLQKTSLFQEAGMTSTMFSHGSALPILPVSPISPISSISSKVFRHSIDIYLKDSNATGNIYFARYFEWQGICRERWFFECISADMLAPLGVFITKDAQQKYIHETFAFQKVECEVSTTAIKQCSFSLLFQFFVEGRLVSTGHQQIVFANKDKKISRLPEHILEKIRQYENPRKVEMLSN